MTRAKRVAKRRSKSEKRCQGNPRKCPVQSRIPPGCTELEATSPRAVKRRSFTKNSLNANNRVLK